MAIDSHEPSASLRTVIAVLSWGGRCAPCVVGSVLLGAVEESVLLCRLRGDGAAVQGVDLVGVVGQDLAAAQLH